MDGILKKGTLLTSESGSRYEVVQKLGAGGQGEVYEVLCNKKPFALKLYFPKTATIEQKSILLNLIRSGAPDDVFLWPLDIINNINNSYGYIMPLRPQNFKSIVDMMKRRAEPSFKTLCRVAFNLAKGYNKLHGKGFVYRDISFSNLFFDPDNGDVLICDNDNVSHNEQEAAVFGTPRFMAPEIVTGKEKPSTRTDLFSLSVLLFYMFMLNHPLEGKQEAAIKCMDIPAMNKLYGTNPIFIFDPADDSNRPEPGYHDNADIFWQIYPQQIRDLFTQAFTEGLTNPGKRITERQWLDVFANMHFGIISCPCGAEAFYDKGTTITCWNCERTFQTPLSLVSGKSRVLLMGDSKIYAHHTDGDYDIDTVAGTVIQNPNNPNLWGIRNDSTNIWTYIKAGGTELSVEPGKSAAIVKSAKINFGQLTGAFI